MENQTFKAGDKLATRSICNWDCIFTGTIVKRTAKTVTVITDIHGEKRCKVYLDDSGNEFIYPHGRYSMAATFNAGDDKVAG